MTTAESVTALGQNTATQKVYTYIRDKILTGEYSSNDRLGEAMIAADLGVSRTPVREALRNLASDGFIELRPHAGAIVKPWNAAEIESSFVIRADIEGHAAARAAERITPAQVQTLEEICDSIEAADGPDLPSEKLSRSTLNRTLHLQLLRIAGLDHAEKIAMQLMDMAVLTMTFSQYTPPEVRRSDSDHRLLIRALRLNDGLLAQSVMRTHILTAAAVLKEQRLGLRD